MLQYRFSLKDKSKGWGLFQIKERNAVKKIYTFDDFVQIIATLRGENGCPWDKVQTHESLRQAMLEESYEVVDAIDKNDMENLKEELGDVLLQIVFHAGIEKDKNNFDINDVIHGICEKMIYRHPHIFGDANANTPEEVLENWEELKKKEKGQQTQTEVLKSIPDALPALTKAKKVQEKAANVGFDFPNLQEATKKVIEEWAELEDAIEKEEKGTDTKTHIEEEFGDLLFALVNIARFLSINPEFTLTKAIKKFINRFEYIEESAISKDKQLTELTLEEMDLLWEGAKRIQKLDKKKNQE